MAEAFPLYWPDGWARTERYRRDPGSKFGNLTFGRARDDLIAEIGRLGGRNVILSSNVALRQDGLPYADRKNPDDPGVAVYFQRKGKPIVMARDAYVRVEANMRSLTLAIDHLRGLERHGGAVMTERAFAGFAQLPAPDSKRNCWEVLGISQSPGTDRAVQTAIIEAAFRAKLKRHHPDVGGTNEQMAEINVAREQALRAVGAI